MSHSEEVGENNVMQNEQEESQHLPPPPPGVGVGGIQTNNQLDILGQLLERVLANRPNTNEESSLRTRVSKAQWDFHQQKPPTFYSGSASISADRWLSAIEEAFRATAIYDNDLRLMTAPSLFRDEAV